jgi:hypothetical protein
LLPVLRMMTLRLGYDSNFPPLLSGLVAFPI